jgi:hypothetical protein
MKITNIMKLNSSSINTLSNKELLNTITYMRNYAKWFQETSLEAAHACSGHLGYSDGDPLSQDITYLEDSDETNLLPDVYTDLLLVACDRGLDV